MTLIAVFFFWFIGAVMHHTEGHYDSSAGKMTIFFFVTVAAMLWKPQVLRDTFRSKKAWDFSLALCAALGCYTLAHKPLMIYANEQSPWMPAFHALTWIAAGFTALLPLAVLGPVDKPKFQKFFVFSALAAISCLFAAQCLVPILSPKPWIDVWVNNTAAVDHFLHGVNPYTQDYPDIYRGAYDYKPGFLYFPGLLYWSAPFRWILGDIRYGFVFANLLIAGGAVFLARRKQIGWSTSLLFALLWLGFPVVFFVLEQAWIDTTLGAMAVMAFLAIAYRRWVLCGLFLGAALVLKQYGCLIAFFAVIHIWREAGLKSAIKTTLWAAVISVVTILPFVASDFASFYSSTVAGQSTTAPRLDAYNATIYFAREYGWLMPASGRLALALLGIFLSTMIVIRRKVPDLATVAVAFFISFGVAFIFGKWAFCNYYYLIASVLLLYLVVIEDRSGLVPLS